MAFERTSLSTCAACIRLDTFLPERMIQVVGRITQVVRTDGCFYQTGDQVIRTDGCFYQTYESKALNWPAIKVEDGKALNRFSIYLAGCKNAMEGSQYSSKFDQPDSIQKLILKLTFNMRERWRRVIDNIMEQQKRPVKFDDVVTTPKETSTVAPISGTCPFCNFRHSLKDCKSLRSRPYHKRIQFLASKSLCFGCLSNKHVAKDCPQRKSCKFTNCPKKHPTVLHTQPPETFNSGASSANANTANESISQVRNGMVSIDTTLCGLTGAGCSKIGMAVVPVKVRRKGSDTAIITYAFLDNGSSSTFCTESLMRQLGVNGLKTRISLTTLEN